MFIDLLLVPIGYRCTKQLKDYLFCLSHFVLIYELKTIMWRLFSIC